MVTQVGKALGSRPLRWPPPHVGTEDWAVRGQVLPRLMRPQPLVCTDDLPSRHCCSKGHGAAVLLHAGVRGRLAGQLNLNKDVGGSWPLQEGGIGSRAGRTPAPASPHPAVAAGRERVRLREERLGPHPYSAGPEEEAGAERALRGWQEAREGRRARAEEVLPPPPQLPCCWHQGVFVPLFFMCLTQSSFLCFRPQIPVA